MSESIIRALMHLFAIIESIKVEIVETSEIIVKPYLKKQLSQELVNKYLSLYEDYVGFYRREMIGVSSEVELELKIKNIIEVTKICSQLNSELLQHERVILFIQLIELINTDKNVSAKEDEFIQLVAMNFNILTKEINDIKSFILDMEMKDLSKDVGLIIDNKQTEWAGQTTPLMKNKKVSEMDNFKHIYEKNMLGKIIVLHIKSVNILVSRYTGPLNIYLEGNKMVSGRSYLIKPGAIIKGANIETIYEHSISRSFLLNTKKIKIVLYGEEIHFHFKNSENGIRPFVFYEESGSMVGIMGGSGTGKSTLINLLNGKIKPTSGKIQINGYSIQKCIEEGVIGYVPQDDMLVDELTVYQNLYFNAKLCFGNFSEKLIDETIHKVLLDFDIAEIKDLTVGNALNKFISGGQRKRLNIALELMRKPSVLFVDEPTSGLSSMDSEKVINLFKNEAMKGKLVIIIIHQPSSNVYKLFDKLWILDKGGFPIYNGNPIDAVVYFKTMNTQVNAAESECHTCGNVIPEQILNIIESKNIDEKGYPTLTRKVSPKAWYEKYRKNLLPKLKSIKWQHSLPPSNFQIPNLYQQLKLFLKRVILSKYTNKQYIFINIVQPPLLALILGFLSKYSVGDEYIFRDNKNLPVYLFMYVVVALFLGLSVSAEEIFRDKKILERESFLNLSKFSYINSKIIYLFTLSAFQMLVFVLVGNYILEIKGMVFSFWIILFSTTCFANMIGLNLSSGLNSIVAIYILIPLILVPQLLLGGAMIKFDELHHGISKKKYVPIIGDLMTSRWAYEALTVEQFKNNTYEKNFYIFDQKISQYSFKTSFLIPKLDSKLEKIFQNIQNKKDSSYTKQQIKLLKNEFKKLNIENKNIPYNKLNSLKIQFLDSNIYMYTKQYLDNLKTSYLKQKNSAFQDREAKYAELINEIGKEGVYKLKSENHNTTLTDLVLNRIQLNKIYESNSYLIQKKDPIFMKPDSKIGRAQFYTPFKLIGNIKIDTLYFNIIVIWLMSIAFYFLLFYDGLRKFIKMLERLNPVSKYKEFKKNEY